jgi:hypothetical protein
MQTTETLPAPPDSQPDGVAMPIVKLNRWTLVLGISLGWLLQQPLITTLLLLLLIPAVLGGQRWSPIANLGKWLFARQIPTAEREDCRLMRFNNTIAVLLLGLAQLAFAFGLPLVGWIVAGLVVVAAAVALAGFCVGCFLYYQFKLQRSAWFGR